MQLVASKARKMANKARRNSNGTYKYFFKVDLINLPTEHDKMK